MVLLKKNASEVCQQQESSTTSIIFVKENLLMAWTDNSNLLQLMLWSRYTYFNSFRYISLCPIALHSDIFRPNWLIKIIRKKSAYNLLLSNCNKMSQFYHTFSEKLECTWLEVLWKVLFSFNFRAQFRFLRWNFT